MAGSGIVSTGSAPRLLQGQGKAKSAPTNPGSMIKCANCGKAVSSSVLGSHIKTHMDSTLGENDSNGMC